ncbi:unnamed protein product [Meganyctiphanes norvegica]|uniref:Protein HTATIP2 n=1 Tax=Meganyctiphanes norvegica TaxID=48144 RepID=A0AAV2S7I7_MEGNR
MTDGMTAVVLGGSGEVGKNIVKQLVDNTAFSKVILITRRMLDFSSDKIEQKIVDFDKLEEHKDAFSNAQVGFCALGTTRKKAGAAGFVKVDRDYVAEAAKLLRDQGCQQFHLVTSGGSNKDSLFLYMKTKGEVEELIKEMNFPKYMIYRPNMLLGNREEPRPLEYIAQTTLRCLDRYRWGSIEVERVAAAMVAKALEKPLPEQNDVYMKILENADILAASKVEN